MPRNPVQFGIYTVGERFRSRKGKLLTTAPERQQTMLDIALLAQEVGLDVFAVGEHHNPDFVHSSPAVTLAYLAARTEHLRLSTATTLITTNDPVRIAEEFATLQFYAPNRIDLMLGRGNVPPVYSWFGKNQNNAAAIARESHGLLRRLWLEENITWKGRHRPNLKDFTSIPRPAEAGAPFIWHGGVRDLDIADHAAEFGEGFFHNHIFQPSSLARDVVARYREQYESRGHGRAADAIVGLGGQIYVAETSQRAHAEFRPYYEAVAPPGAMGYEEFLRETPLAVGSAGEVIEKVLGYREYIGDYQRQLFLVDGSGVSHTAALRQVELLGTEVVPTLRQEFDARRAAGVPSDPPASLPVS